MNKRLEKLVLVLLIAFLFKPAYISQAAPPIVNLIYEGLKMVGIVAIMIMYLFYNKVSPMFIQMCLMQISLFFSTMLYGEQAQSYLSDCLTMIAVFMLYDTMLRRDPRQIISATAITFGMFVHINTLTWLLFPEGMYVHEMGVANCWFLGYDNVSANVILIAMVASMYHSLSSRGKLSFFTCSLIISGGSFLIVNLVATGVAGLAFFAVSILALHFKGINKRLSCRAIIIGNFILFVLLVFVQALDLFDSAYTILGKSGAMNERLRLWTILAESIPRSPIFGYGVNNNVYYLNVTGWKWTVHAHSYYLQLLYEGGGLAFLFFSMILLKGANAFDKLSVRYESHIFKAALVAYMFMFQTERYALSATLYIVVMMLYHISNIEQQYAETRSVRSSRKLHVRRRLALHS